MNTSSRLAALLSHVEKSLLKFWLKPASPKPLAILRIGVGAVLLYQACSWWSSCTTLFGPNGLISWKALQSSPAFTMDVHGPFHLSYLADLLSPFDVSPEETVRIVFGVYLLALLGLLAGCWTRSSAAIAFLMNVILTSTGITTTYGVDQFARISLFYCLCFPVGLTLSIDAWRKKTSVKESVSARIGLRTVQLHMVLMYLATGIHKASGPQWWDGEAIWRAITLPQLATVDMTWLSNWPTLLVLLGWGTLAIELGYIVFAWHRSTRWITVGSIISMHIGIALFMGLVSFAMIMIALNIAAFLIPSEPGSDRQLCSTAQPRMVCW